MCEYVCNRNQVHSDVKYVLFFVVSHFHSNDKNVKSKICAAFPLVFAHVFDVVCKFVIEMKFIDVKIRFCILSSLNFTPRSKKLNLKIVEHSPLFLGMFLMWYVQFVIEMKIIDVKYVFVLCRLSISFQCQKSKI
jgi:hypothetical protein